MITRDTASARCMRFRWRSVSSRIGRWATGGMGVSSGMNNGRAMGMRQGGGGGNNGGARRRQPMSQAQSDARMSQDLRTLQGINMQLGSQGNYTCGPRPGKRTRPAGNPRAECRSIDPLKRIAVLAQSVFDSLERLGDQEPASRLPRSE